jgi:hypothetical protein
MTDNIRQKGESYSAPQIANSSIKIMDKSLVKCNNKVNKLSKYQPKND